MTLWGNGSKTKPRVSSKYGPRKGGAFSFHYGTDFVGYTSMKAIMAGTVTMAAWMNNSAGNTIAIDSKLPDGRVVTIVRMHVGHMTVRRGQKVSEGQTIGTMGSTGNATGPCDHVEIRFWNSGKMSTVDPEIWLAQQVKDVKPKPKPTSRNPFGIPWVAGLQKIARLNGGNTAIDQIWGPQSAKGFAQFLRARWGYRGNDVLGPVMWAAIARWLRARWGYKGNDVPGPVMCAALQRAEAANYKAL